MVFFKIQGSWHFIDLAESSGETKYGRGTRGSRIKKREKSKVKTARTAREVWELHISHLLPKWGL
jgi:hypothetical protein